jgi:hypothetical protein
MASVRSHAHGEMLVWCDALLRSQHQCHRGRRVRDDGSGIQLGLSIRRHREVSELETSLPSPRTRCESQAAGARAMGDFGCKYPSCLTAGCAPDGHCTKWATFQCSQVGYGQSKLLDKGETSVAFSYDSCSAGRW